MPRISGRLRGILASQVIFTILTWLLLAGSEAATGLGGPDHVVGTCSIGKWMVHLVRHIFSFLMNFTLYILGIYAKIA